MTDVFLLLFTPRSVFLASIPTVLSLQWATAPSRMNLLRLCMAGLWFPLVDNSNYLSTRGGRSPAQDITQLVQVGCWWSFAKKGSQHWDIQVITSWCPANRSSVGGSPGTAPWSDCSFWGWGSPDYQTDCNLGRPSAQVRCSWCCTALYQSHVIHCNAIQTAIRCYISIFWVRSSNVTHPGCITPSLSPTFWWKKWAKQAQSPATGHTPCCNTLPAKATMVLGS